MALTDKREEAERLYVRQSLSCPAIAAKLEINEGTVYRWKAEAAEKGEAENWDFKRRRQHVSALELIEIYIEAVRDQILTIRDNPALILDPGKADALTKHISNIRKLDIRGQYLDATIDLIKIASRWLAENRPELKEKLDPYWDAIYQELADYSTKKGTF
jgi:hypothetical protein